MQNAEQQIKQLQAQLSTLKVRVFDAEEMLGAERAQTNEIMQALVNTLQVQGDENGNVTIEGIMKRASDLVEAEAAQAVELVEAEEVEA